MSRRRPSAAPRKRVGLGQVHGELHPAAKLTEARVRQLRARVARDPDLIRRGGRGGGLVVLEAARLGVSKACITMALSGATWAHVPMPSIAPSRRRQAGGAR